MKFISSILVVSFIVCILWYSNANQHPNLGAKSSPVVLGAQIKTSQCQASGPLPDPGCTPGAIFPNVTKDQVCVSGYSGSVRNVPISTKKQVYDEYGITHHVSGEYEVDHFISLELGGSNDIANLWPEPANPTPGFHQKDLVENYLHEQVCSGMITLQEAQQKISHDWVSVYSSVQNIGSYTHKVKRQ